MKASLGEQEMTSVNVSEVNDSFSSNPRASLTAASSGYDGGLGSTLVIPVNKRRGCLNWIREALNLKVANSSEPRVIPLGVTEKEWSGRTYSPNVINNRRYSFITFLPLSLINQFKNFFNVFYLFLAFSQVIPALKVGFLFTYFSPLAMVVCLSLLKDALNELQRFRQDHAANIESYTKLIRGGELMPVRSCDIKVGDLLLLHHNQRIPADCILVHTSEKNGTTFVRTDQLDGETDWKLRFPLNTTKGLTLEELSRLRVNIRCEPLHKDIYKFDGVLDTAFGPSEGIGLENTLWTSCVVASGTLVGVVVHTGADTRSAMNSTKPRTKRGLIEDELNYMGILCFLLLMTMSFFLVVLQKFKGDWFVMIIRFFILLSAMIPISMRVNVDVARLWYSHDLSRDAKIRGTVTRNSDLPEELGRLQYLFSDKTGTLTKNRMEFRVLQLAADSKLTDRDAGRFSCAIHEYFGIPGDAQKTAHNVRNSIGAQKSWFKEVHAVGEMIRIMVLCHNVNPVVEENHVMEYQASSPDEVALVKFCSSLGVTLCARDINSMSFTIPSGRLYTYDIVKVFPFTSDRKCMSIIVRQAHPDSQGSGEYYYYMKGADVKMATVVRPTDWLDECCQELAQVGLRTLVFASRTLTEDQVNYFLQRYNAASAVIGEGRSHGIEAAMRLLERDMTLLGVSGVEDELQDDVVMTLETLGMCGIKVWVLTGDKVETATTIGRSTRLIPRHGTVEYVLSTTMENTWSRLRQLQNQYDPAIVGDHLVAPWTLILDGTALSHCFHETLADMFADVARSAYSVVVARCSPTQKAHVVQLMQAHSNKTVRMAAIGDGGNDVAMILAANVGIGIEGVEGKQASMAADFSVTRFSHCLRLIMWHGRNSYRRTCRLSQFIMHRGLVYSVVQAVFSMLFAGTTMSVFNGYLLMGYSTLFTMAPAFALVLDEDFNEADINEYPLLYKELVKSRSMNTRTFLQWIWISFFQGGVMMCVSLQLFSDEMFQIVTIAYTSLLMSELVIIGSTVHLSILWRQRRLHYWLFLAAECFSLIAFFLAVLVLPDTFDQNFFFSWNCWWRVGVICLASIGPLVVFKLIGKHFLFNKKFINLFSKYL